MALFLNYQPVDTGRRFPDGTFSFRIKPESYGFGISHKAIIRWNYEGESECMALYYLVEHLRSNRVCSLTLQLPYLPNARMDRVHGEQDVFTLKHFAKFINSLLFDRVIVLDPHSNVAAALIDRIEISSPKGYIEGAIETIGDPGIALFYPDEGAMKRYSEMIDVPYGFGVKHRDWDTGKITGLEILGPAEMAGKNVLIVDDICSRGGTLYHSAKALADAGAKEIFCYVSHCENTILSGPLMDAPFIRHIYTTNSLFTGKHEKITAFDWSP